MLLLNDILVKILPHLKNEMSICISLIRDFLSRVYVENMTTNKHYCFTRGDTDILSDPSEDIHPVLPLLLQSQPLVVMEAHSPAGHSFLLKTHPNYGPGYLTLAFP